MNSAGSLTTRSNLQEFLVVVAEEDNQPHDDSLAGQQHDFPATGHETIADKRELNATDQNHAEAVYLRMR